MPSAKLKIAVFTATRAEYGLLRWLLAELASDKRLDLEIIVSGQHLSASHGMTINEIKQDGFRKLHIVDVNLDCDDDVSISKAMGAVTAGVSKVLADVEADMLMLLGDRYELLAAASAATICRVPIAHIHGGEITEGAFDDSIRHAITKLSTRHFVATESSRQRVIQLGEQPDTVFNFGGLGVDAISRIDLMADTELTELLGYELCEHSFLTTFHPVTVGQNSDDEQVSNLLDALTILADELDSLSVVITAPNADPGRNIINEKLKAFCDQHEWAHFHLSLGQRGYFSVMSRATVVVGNSSSGILEAPSFGLPTVNIGTRQAGRERAATIIDCGPTSEEIVASLRYAMSPEMRMVCESAHCPYGQGGAAKLIAENIGALKPTNFNSKTFFDLQFSLVDKKGN